MRPRHIIGAISVALALVARDASGQRAGMPDLSGAPADIQAIWKKVQSGGVPTPTEAQKLGQYLAAHSAAIQSAARGRADSVRVAAPQRAATALGPSADPSKACPTSPSAPITLATMTAAGASAYLDTITRTVLSRETPAAANRLRTGLASIKDGDRLEMTGTMFHLAGFDGAAIVTFAEAARRAGPAAQRRWTNLGAVLVSYGDPTRAAAALRYATTLGHPYPLLVHELGVAYADLGELAVAESLLTRATTDAPSFGLAWDALARVQSCRGNMTAAWRSLARAQETDWNDRRGKILDHHDPESKDDRVEAQKPFPEPSGSHVFPVAGEPQPVDFSAQTPVLGSTWHENLGHPVQFLKAANAYRGVTPAIEKEGADAEAAALRAMDAAERSSGALAKGSYVLSVSFENSREAIAAVEKIRARMSAKEQVLLADHATRDSVIMLGVLDDQQKREDQYTVCRRNAKDDEGYRACRVPYCRSKLEAADRHYSEFRDNARVFIGGMTGLADRYDGSMRKWFRRAPDPVRRIRIDTERRSQLAEMLVTTFTVAATVGPNDVPSEPCFDPQEIAALNDLVAREAAQANPGPCSSFDKTIPFVVTIQGDCKHMRMTLDLSLDLPATPTLEYRRAEHGHAGKIFVGGGEEWAHGLVAGEAGLAVTFNEGGWVQGFGPAATVTVGNDLVATGTASGMINLLDHGPAGDASVGFNGFGYQASIATDTGFSGNFH